MTRSRLLCARCGGPVAQGRCSSCRSAREALHSPADTVAVWLLALALVLLTVLALTAGGAGMR